MGEAVAWFLVWIPRKEEEKRKIQEEQGRKITEARRQEVVEGASKEQQGQEATKKEIQEAGNGQGSQPVDITLEPPKAPSLQQNLAAAVVTHPDGGGGSSASVRVINVKEVEVAEGQTELLTTQLPGPAPDSSPAPDSTPAPAPPGTPDRPTAPTPVAEQELEDIHHEDILTLEEILNKVLAELAVSALTWQPARDKTSTLAMFYVRSSAAEDVLHQLRQAGIGTDFSSSVTVLRSSLHYEGQEEQEQEQEVVTKEEVGVVEDQVDRFYSSIKSRMMVGEVITNIENNAHFTFDFLLLLVLAGVIAFLGLVESSSVTLVASMLISPLMGPILAGVFGAVIGDKKLRNQGVVNELVSLGICIVTGFVLGLLVCPWIEVYGVKEWPTTEMRSRGELRALWVGVLVAVPSGAGVALSVLGGNTGSLVGVAISASLLPPAVNAGFFWALSLLTSITEGSVKMYAALEGNQTQYLGYYSQHQPTEAALLGLVSLALTLINIVCIVLTGIAILRLKEVTPDKIPQTFSEFWRNDVRQARKGKYSRLGDVDDLMEQGQLAGLDGTLLQGLFDEAATDGDISQLRRWVVAGQGAVTGGRSRVGGGPGYRVNKAMMLRMKRKEEEEREEERLLIGR